MLQKIIKPENCILAFGVPTSKEDFYADLRIENKDFAKMVMGKRERFDIYIWEKYEKDIIGVIQEVESVMKKAGVTIIHKLTLEGFNNILRTRTFDAVILLSHWKSELNRTCFTKQEYIDFLERNPDFLELVEHSFEALEWLIEDLGNLSSLAEIKLLEQRKDGKAPLLFIKKEKVYAKYKEIIFNHLKELKVETYLELLKHTSTSRVEFYDGLKNLYEIVTRIPLDFDGLISLDICDAEDLATALRKCRPNCHVRYKFKVPKKYKSGGVIPRFILYFYMTLFIHLKRNDLTYLQAFEEVSNAFLKCGKKKGGRIEKIKGYF